jgi:hypothetical protein
LRNLRTTKPSIFLDAIAHASISYDMHFELWKPEARTKVHIKVERFHVKWLGLHFLILDIL